MNLERIFKDIVLKHLIMINFQTGFLTPLLLKSWFKLKGTEFGHTNSL